MREGFQKASQFNKIIINKRLNSKDLAQIEKHKTCPEIALWNTRHDDLRFLSLLSSLISLEMYGVNVKDYGALQKLPIQKLFLNRVTPHQDLSFISQMKKLQELSLLYLPKLEVFPDLSQCKHLKKITLWNCKRLKYIESLKFIPKLQEITLIDTPQEPNDLVFLMECKQVRYISSQFGNNKSNKHFDDLLKKYKKRPLKEAVASD